MLHTARFSALRSGVQRKLLLRRVEIGVVTLTLTLIVLTSVLSILLLLHANEVATKGYELRELRLERQDLTLKNERLLAQVAHKKSLGEVRYSTYVQDNMLSMKDFVIIDAGTALVRK